MGGLELSVLRSNNEHLPVTLSMSGLPPGVSASVKQISDTLAYTHIFFEADTTAVAGSYSINITGTTPFSTKSYSAKFIVAELQYFFLDNVKYRIDTFLRDESSSIASWHIVNRRNQSGLIFQFQSQKLPRLNSKYKISPYTQNDDEVSISIYLNSGQYYSSTGTDNKFSSFTYKNGKLGVALADVDMAIDFNTRARLSASLIEY